MVRRVVTGRDASGKAVFVSDEELERKVLDILPQGGAYDIWGNDASSVAPNDGTKPRYHLNYPPALGYRVNINRLQPDSWPMPDDVDWAVVTEQMEQHHPGAGQYVEADNPGMHTTPTVDIITVLDGEIWAELDDGAEAQLKQGDFIVQNGTRHAWRNKSDKVCTILCFLVGAEVT